MSDSSNQEKFTGQSDVQNRPFAKRLLEIVKGVKDAPHSKTSDDANEAPFSVANKGEAAISFLDFLKGHTLRKVVSILRSRKLLEKSPGRKHFSLVDLTEGKIKPGEINSCFEGDLGSVVLPKDIDIQGSPFEEFFTPERIFRSEQGVQLRGKNYFVALDETKNTPDKKLDSITADIKDALDILQSTNREQIQNKRDFLLYLGVIDYLKNSYQILFHLITYDERQGIIQSPPDNQQYLVNRQKSFEWLENSTRMYYQTLLGLDYDQDANTGNILEVTRLKKFALNQLNESIKRNNGKPHMRFKYPEVNHPLVIALGAQEAVLKHNEANVVAGIPSGGTEAAIIAKLFYKLIHKKDVELTLLQISLHSGMKTRVDSEKLSEIISQYNDQFFTDKRVLIIDDNSSTGATVDNVALALLNKGAVSISVHVVEADPRRFLPGEKFKRDDDPNYNRYFDQMNSPTTMGIMKRERGFQKTAYERKIRQILSSEQEELANAS